MSTPTATRVLVVDDEVAQREALGEMVASLGFEAVTASNGRDALELHAENPVDLILTDLIMPDIDGFELLKNLEEHGDRTPTIVLTGFGSIEKAISVVHDLKAFWFLEKPVKPAILRALIERAAAPNRLVEEAEVLNRQLSFHGVLGDLVGNSRTMRQVFSEIQQVAPTSASVLITGESGTGKELVARALHRLSPRSGGPFVPVNCAALTETLIESELFGHEKGSFTGALERHIGCFEQANNGTVFLDEIGDMPIGTQAKLLRVLEERKVRRLGGKTDLPVEVRVVAATNKVPEEAIKAKLLREDLFYRLNVFHIMLAPLRDRKDDIPAISDAILVILNKKHGCRITGLHAGTLEQFQNYAWPGNIRELRNVLERAAIMAGEGLILPKHLAMEPMAAQGDLRENAAVADDADDVPAAPAGRRRVHSRALRSHHGRDRGRLYQSDPAPNKQQQDQSRRHTGHQCPDFTQSPRPADEKQSQHRHGLAHTSAGVFHSSGNVNVHTEPLPGADSILIVPPWTSTIFWQMVNPSPTPPYFLPSSRLKGSNTVVHSSGSIPMPLSSTRMAHIPGNSRAAETRITGGAADRKRSELPIRFRSKCIDRSRLSLTLGKSTASTIAAQPRILPSSSATTILKAD